MSVGASFFSHCKQCTISSCDSFSSSLLQVVSLSLTKRQFRSLNSQKPFMTFLNISALITQRNIKRIWQINCVQECTSTDILRWTSIGMVETDMLCASQHLKTLYINICIYTFIYIFIHIYIYIYLIAFVNKYIFLVNIYIFKHGIYGQAGHVYMCVTPHNLHSFSLKSIRHIFLKIIPLFIFSVILELFHQTEWIWVCVPAHIHIYTYIKITFLDIREINTNLDHVLISSFGMHWLFLPLLSSA